MKSVQPSWFVIVAYNTVLGLPVWLSSRTPWWARILAFIALNFILLPLALWIRRVRERRKERSQQAFWEISHAIDAVAREEEENRQGSDGEAEPSLGTGLIRKRIRHTSRTNRYKESDPPLDSIDGGRDG